MMMITRMRMTMSMMRMIEFECLALFALRLNGSDMSGALQYRNSEVALLIIAFDSPTLLRMILNAELAGKATNAEVDHVVVV